MSTVETGALSGRQPRRVKTTQVQREGTMDLTLSAENGGSRHLRADVGGRRLRAADRESVSAALGIWRPLQQVVHLKMRHGAALSAHREPLMAAKAPAPLCC